mmetsp:Transcript_42404/g.92476  ORF Transcript_42404/g.92476 Transcript_42404/m.92476 type:complete len:224 (-) Transcript_42404:616-1287(-)
MSSAVTWVTTHSCIDSRCCPRKSSSATMAPSRSAVRVSRGMRENGGTSARRAGSPGGESSGSVGQCRDSGVGPSRMYGSNFSCTGWLPDSKDSEARGSGAAGAEKSGPGPSDPVLSSSQSRPGGSAGGASAGAGLSGGGACPSGGDIVRSQVSVPERTSSRTPSAPRVKSSEATMCRCCSRSAASWPCTRAATVCLCWSNREAMAQRRAKKSSLSGESIRVLS